MVIAVAHGVILEDELTGDRRVGIERGRSGQCQLLVAQRADRGGCGGAVGAQRFDRGLFRDRGVIDRVFGVQCMDVVHRQTGERLAAGDRLRDVDLDRVDEGDVMDDDAHRAPVGHAAGFPLRVGQGGGEGGERPRALFETVGQSVGTTPGHSRW